MKIALTFLTLAVVLLLGSLMWGMMTYTDLAHARSEVKRLQGEVDEYRKATLGAVAGNIPVPTVQPAAPAVTAPQPAISDQEMEAKLEAMMAEKLLAQQERATAKENDLVSEMRALQLEADKQKQELDALRTEKERFSPTSLSDQQNRIAKLPALARVSDVSSVSGYNFLVINAGENKGIEPGKTFSLRRGHMIVGAIEIDTVEEEECIANIVKDSVPTGVELKTGDEVVDYFES